MLPKILIPVNDSAAAERTIAAIIANRERFPVTLTLLHVVDTDRLAYRMIPDFQVEMVRDKAMQVGETTLNRIKEKFNSSGISTIARLESGSPREVITRVANDENFSLLVIGRRGMGEVRDVLFGSVSNHVLHHVNCPVLLV
ncbi:MAG: universal stress protein [Desulfuromonas sp.]|nr:MAG: universal stress protein [Desulfuromonas sp.]